MIIKGSVQGVALTLAACYSARSVVVSYDRNTFSTIACDIKVLKL
jgi:hypothetical protein